MQWPRAFFRHDQAGVLRLRKDRPGGLAGDPAVDGACEEQVQADRFLVIVHGTPAVIARARRIAAGTASSASDGAQATAA